MPHCGNGHSYVSTTYFCVDNSVERFSLKILGVHFASILFFTDFFVLGIADSLSMIFATAFVLQQLLTFNRTFKESRSITAILSTAVIGFSILHCKINDLNVHSAVFASMVLFIAYRVTALTKQMKNPALQRHAGHLARYGGGNIKNACLFKKY